MPDAPDWETIASAVEGTTMMVGEISERYQLDHLDPQDIEVALEEHGGINCCPGCGWWWNDNFLDADGFCEDCVAE